LTLRREPSARVAPGVQVDHLHRLSRSAEFARPTGRFHRTGLSCTQRQRAVCVSWKRVPPRIPPFCPESLYLLRRTSMSFIRYPALLGAVFTLALSATQARSGEVPADPVFRSCRPAAVRYCGAPLTTYRMTVGHDPCCQPCRVGPVRRFLRRVFRPCCPPPCPAPSAAVFVPTPPPTAAVWVPPAAPPGRLQPEPMPPLPPSPPTIPGTGSALRRQGVLTPPTPPPPVRADRIASTGGQVIRAKVDMKDR
jgi:hypothetical protein